MSEASFHNSESAQSASGPGGKSLFRFAVWYADRGWPVLALARRSKLPLVSKKNGGKGVHDATSDIEQISSWWAKEQGLAKSRELPT